MINNHSILEKLNSNIDHFAEQLPGSFGIKDTDGKYLFTNQNNADLCGFQTPDEMIGVTDYELKSNATFLADAFRKHDKMAITQGEITSLEYIDCKPGIKLFLDNKKSFLNKEKNIIGSFFYLTELTQYHLIDLAYFLVNFNSKFSQHHSSQQFSFTLSNNYFDTHLSTRQAECLFFLLRGKSAKTIAKILELSIRTVEDHIDNIKNQFRCYKKSELIEKAWTNGYMTILPKSLINKNLIDKLKIS